MFALRFSRRCGFFSCAFLTPFLLSLVPALAIDGPLSPEDSLKYLRTEPGLKVELVASEPMVIDPVAVAWDEKGRMYVVEDRGYPVGPGKGKPPIGRVLLLEDTHGDGKYDKRTVFADGLTFPNGVMPWKGGVYVTCAPYLYYFKDTDGDGKADIKEVVFKGFQDLSTTQLRVSHPTLNVDNWVYLTSGLTAAKVSASAHTNRPIVFLNRVDGRFRPGTDALEETAGTAQFGQTFNSFGRKFICSNRNHLQHVVMQSDYLKRNPFLPFSLSLEDIPDHGAASRVYPLSANITTAAFHAGYFTSACGVTIYQGSDLPEAYYGNSFTCEPAGNLVHHDVISPSGVTFTASRMYPTNEFLASPDNWFRPVNLANGPDGAFYVCDMYRKTIEHPEYLPEATRAVTDFESGKTMGRIYRVVSEQGRLQRRRLPFDLSKSSIAGLCAEFNNPNIWWRMTAQRLLLERQDAHAVPILKELSRKGKTPEARLHAMRSLEGLNALDEDQIIHALRDPFPALREHAIQLAEPLLAHSARLVTEVMRLSADVDARVRFQCALSLGGLDENRKVPSLARIAYRGVGDKWVRAAALSGIQHYEERFLQAFLEEKKNANPEGLNTMMTELGHMLGAALSEDRLRKVMQELFAAKDPANLPWQMAAGAGFGEGIRLRPNNNSTNLLTLSTLPQAQNSELKAALESLFHGAGEVALDAGQPMDSRVSAIGLLGQADFSLAQAPLVKLMDPLQPSEIQSASIRSLSLFNNPEVGAELTRRDRWGSYTPAVRDIVLTALMANTNFLQSLFDAVQKQDVPAYTVNADRRGQLMKHKDEGIRKRATELFKDLIPGDRMKIYEEYKSVLALKGNSKNGHAVFRKNCASCHVFSGEGHLVGPDLTGIRNQPAEVLLLHIVVPEYEIMPIYTCYNVETKAGQGFTGLLATENANSITLRMAQGIEQQIPRSDIATMTTSRLSLMPQELEKAMTKQEFANLLAFLKGE